MAETLTDEELTAFLDGEASADMAQRVEMAGDDVQARLAALQVDRTQIAMAMNGLLSAAPEYVPPQTRAPSNVWKAPAAIAATLALGLFLGWSAPKGEANPTWTEAVASYQALYITQTLSGAEGGPFQEENLVALGETLGVSLSGASDLAPLDFRRAQLLGFEGGPLVQIAYLTDDGTPVALCVLAVDGEDTAPTSSVMLGMAAVEWQKDGFGYLLIGGDDTALIDQVAAQAQALL